MKTNLEKFSANNDLDYYRNKQITFNKKFISETIVYFEIGAGARVFEPLELLNLLEKQRDIVNLNFLDSAKVIEALKALQLQELEKHVLFGFILKSQSGYPVHIIDTDDDVQNKINSTYKLIQNEFLSYPEDTPEKEFCKADANEQRMFMKAGIVLTNAIQGNIDPKLLWDAIPDLQPTQNNFSTFDQLFDTALAMETLPAPSNNGHKAGMKNYHNFYFNVWLQNNKSWEYGNESQYKQLLTKENWIQYLQQEKQLESERQEDFESKKQSWQIKPQNIVGKDEIKWLMERMKLHEFLSLPAPDIIDKNAFLHDENDLLIEDLDNPKYLKMVTSDNINFITSDGKKVIKRDFIQSQTRLAENEQDFELIYKREFDCKNLKDTFQTKAVFCVELTNYIQELIELHKKNSNYKQSIDINLLGIANELIEYVKSKITIEVRSEDEKNNELTYLTKVNELYNLNANEIRDKIDYFFVQSPIKGIYFYNHVCRAATVHFGFNLFPDKRNVILEYCNYKSKEVESNQLKNENIKDARKGVLKTFPKYLLHESRDVLADKLKSEFTTEKGKGIRLLIEVLQSNEPQLLNVENRQRRAVYNAIKTHFNRNIGTYNSVYTSYKFNANKDQPDFAAIKVKVDFILNSISKQA